MVDETEAEYDPSDKRFRLAAIAGCVVVFAVGMYLRFDYDPPAPRRPPRPHVANTGTLASLDFSPGLYQAGLEKDSIDLNVSATTPEALSGVLAYDLAEPHAQVVPDGPGFETRNLKLTTRVADITATFTRGTITLPHLILRIENKTDQFIAYRVDTTPDSPKSCMDKGDLRHNALALAPHQAIERTECVTRSPTMPLSVDRIETVALPPLSFYYVSQLFPPHIGLDSRATRGHTPPKGEACNDIPEQAIRRGMEQRLVSWKDVIDFYARHNCRQFMFPVGYRAFSQPGEWILPVSPAQVAAHSPKP